MSGRLEERMDEACGRWIAAVDRRPGLVVAITALLTVFLAIYAARNLGVDADPNALVSQDRPFFVHDREFNKAFHSFQDEILVVIDAETPVRARRAADALAAKLGARKDLFSAVTVPGGGPFFARNGLLYLSVSQLEELSDRLAQVQPFLAELQRDPSLAGIAGLLRQALTEQREGHGVDLDLASALDRVSTALEAAAAGHPAPDPWSEALLGGGLVEDATQRVVSLQPRLNFTELLSAAPAVKTIHADARELGLDPSHGVRVRVTGDPILNYEELLVVSKQGKILAIGSFLLAAASLWVAMRSLRVVLASLASLLVGLVASNAFCAFAIGHLNQISSAFNVLIVGLGTEFGIHICMRYAELAAHGRSRPEALAETGSSLGSSLLFSAGTTSIGFFVFLPTDYRGVAELGFITGAGILISLVCSFTVLPALLSLGAPVYPRMPRPDFPLAHRLQHLPVKWARPIRWVTAVCTVIMLFLLPRVSFDHNPVNLRDPSTESVQAFQDLLAHSGTSPWTLDAVAPNLTAAQAEAKKLEALPTVKDAITLADYVPADQDEKIEILQTAALFVPPPARPEPPPPLAAQRTALEQLRAELDLAAGRDTGKLGTAAGRLRDAVDHFLAGAAAVDPGPAFAAAQAAVVGSLPEQVDDLRTALSPEHVTLENLPPEIRREMIAADGRARIEIRARDSLAESAALERFVDEVRTVDPAVVGGAAHLVEWGRITVNALREAMIAAVICMALFLIGISGRVWDTLLAFLPMGLAAGFSCALLVVFGQSFNFANVIVMPMLVGMGIDNGIHLVHRHRTNPEEVDVLSTSTARAVFFSCVTTILSFGAMAFAGHRGMAALGQLLTLGVAMTLLCYVVILPALLEWDDQRRRRRILVPLPKGD